MYRSRLKRICDLLGGAVILIVLSPLLAVTALLIKLNDAGPVFYTQKRLGKNGAIIRIWKFRSMQDRPDRRPGEEGERLSLDHPEITRVGKWIRRYKIDEIPQLIDVIAGRMSLIGPRPCLPELREKFNKDGEKRLEVRPGCTGLAQVQGNINHPWPERWRYDAYYVDHLGLRLDCLILLKTVYLLLVGEEKLYVPFDEFEKSGERILCRKIQT